ncbi:hypothetical protein ACOSQ3_010717 [Xanthoceras sorbifolium]
MVEIHIGSPPSIIVDGRWRSNLDLHQEKKNIFLKFIFEERRTLWVRDRTQRVRRSNPSGFHEPSRVRRSNPPEFRTLWVRGTQRVRSRTQKGSKIRTLLGSWNAEGSKIEPSGFDLRTLLGSRSNPEGFDLQTLLVRDRTQRVRSSNPSGFEIEPSGFNLEPRGFVVLRR